jgi:hypothetical protein
LTLWLNPNVSRMEVKLKSAARNRHGNISGRCLAGFSVGLSLVSVGCSHAPEYSIFGSFFPAWIFCSIGGLLLMTGARAVIVRTAVAEHLAAPVVLYLSMAIFFACVLWILFYS